jgi:sugar phosphate isomerase/epimerase
MAAVRIGGRVSFDRLEDLESFSDVDFPIELALPWRYQELWLPIEDRLKEVLEFFLKEKLEILSIHATQGRISEEAFLTWGKKTLEFANALGVRDVTVHPNQVKSNRATLQEKALMFLRRLQEGSDAKFCIETFRGRKRLFQPLEIVERGLPMTLDVSHIRDNSLILRIIESYWHNIRVVHLSAKGEKEHHLPIDSFCAEVVKLLQSKGWQGNIILEYLPRYTTHLRKDIRGLEKIL